MGKLISSDRLFEAVQGVKNGLYDAKGGMLTAGKWLCYIKEEKLWKADGSPSKSFSHWVENELCLSKSTAYNLMDAYEKVGTLIEGNRDFKDLDMSKVFLLLPYITKDTTEDQKEEMLHMANATTWRGLQDNLRGFRGKKGTDQCDHPPEERETLERCKKCNKWLRD